MFRPKVTTVYVLAPMFVAAAILTSACSSRPEEQQLRQFFRASGMNDQQTLANFSTTNFDPKVDGQVTGFKVVSVSEPKVEPLKIKELNKALEDAQAAD